VSGQLLSWFHLANSACGTNTGLLPSLWDQGRAAGGTSGGGALSCVTINGVATPHIDNVLGVLVVLGNLTRILIAISGGIAIAAILVGSLIWVVSGGDPARIKLGRDIMTNAILGLLVIIVAYAVVTFIVNGF
jgi:hypothetical protein